MKKKKYELFILGMICIMSVMTSCGKTGGTAETKTDTVESGAAQDGKSSSAQNETPEPTPTETPIQMITAEPKETVQEKTPSGMRVEVVDEQYYVITGVNVRSDADVESDLVGGLFTGDTVQVTGICENGWYRIKYSGGTGYVLGGCLSDTAPAIYDIEEL